jgi:ParB-like chromosome segregation protein Spo0J
MGVAADAVGPLEWWPTKRLRPFTPRHVKLPTFRDTPSWAILRHLIKESGVREPLLVLPDGQVIDGAHRLELAKALALPEVPVRVLTVPTRLRDEDRLQVETVLAVLAVARRHIAPSRVSGLLLGLTQAELAAGVRNRGVANLRRGRAPAPGPPGPTQRALAQSTGVSDRTIRRLVRVGREGSEDLRRAVASGDLSVKQADRRLAAAKTTQPPGGPLILRALPKAATCRDDGGHSASGDGRPITTNEAPPRPKAAVPAPVSGASPSAGSPPAAPVSGPIPASVQMLLAMCHELDAATERFRRDTARWTGTRRAQRRLTIWQTIQDLSEQLEWMQATEASRHEPGEA